MYVFILFKMLQILIISGFFLSALLLYFNIRKQPGVIYLGLFFLLISIYSFSYNVIFNSQSVFLVSIVFIIGALPAYLLGPLLYFYVRSIITDSSTLKKADIVHFLPAFVFIIAAFPYLMSPWSAKLDIAEMIIKNREFFWYQSKDLLSWLIPVKINFISRPGLIFLYSLWSLIILIRFRYRKINIPIIRKHSLNFNWLISLLVFSLLLTFAQTLLTVLSILNKNLNFFYSYNILQVFSAIGFMGIILLPFFYPSVLYGLPYYSASRHIKDKIDETVNHSESHSDPKNENREKPFPEFDAAYLQFLEKAVITCMENDKPYLNKECNLSFFARILNVPAHHLSYYFRQVKKQSFNDFRNMWRVRHAKELIANNKHKERTMEAIGMLSGFSSKNAFFAAFKKFENTTPGQYADNLPTK